LLLDPAGAATTECAAVFWRARGAQFVVLTNSDARFRCRLFYTDADHYGTGRDEYDDLANCVLSLLRVQADNVFGQTRRPARGVGEKPVLVEPVR
jgi:hypothetical protein